MGLDEGFIDATFAPGQKRGSLVGKTKKAKGQKIMAIVEEHGYPIALHIESASPGEATLVEKTVEAKNL